MSYFISAFVISCISQPVPEVMTVTQFHLSGWPGDGQPCQPDLLLDLVDRVLKNQISTGNKPVVVMCRLAIVIVVCGMHVYIHVN